MLSTLFYITRTLAVNSASQLRCSLTQTLSLQRSVAAGRIHRRRRSSEREREGEREKSHRVVQKRASKNTRASSLVPAGRPRASEKGPRVVVELLVLLLLSPFYTPTLMLGVCSFLEIALPKHPIREDAARRRASQDERRWRQRSGSARLERMTLARCRLEMESERFRIQRWVIG